MQRMMKKKRTGRLVAVLLTVACLALLAPLAGLTPGGKAIAGGGTVTFHGHGKGHGVGMCMAGVYYRAQRGETYQQIINTYYTGVSFSTIDDNMVLRVKCRDGVVRSYTMHDYCIRQQEEPNSWPIEGMKVTITAFRTYAYSVISRGKHAADGYDICSSGECCQAMNEAIDPANVPNVVAAVNGTSGQVITYNGTPIVAAYSSCCGGFTATANEVWGGTGYPYWQAVYDDGCAAASTHDWDVSMAWPDLEALLDSRSETEVGELYGFVILSNGPSGRVTRMRIEGSSGSKEVSGALFASIAGLPTNFFALEQQNFDEYILLQNPNDETANVHINYMMPQGDQWGEDYAVGPNARSTIYVNGILQNAEVSAAVTSDIPIVAERAMYFDFRGSGMKGGHTSTGATQARTGWYLAEGYCGGGFNSWILLQNPGDTAANAHIQYFGGQGVLEEQDYSLAPRSRYTINVDAIPSLETAEFSAHITSDQPIVAERSMYFDSDGRGGGSCAPPIDSLSQQWYFAEGYTGGNFDTWLLVMNPDDTQAAKVTSTFMLPGGATKEYKIEVPPRSRGTIHIDAVPGLEFTDVSTRIDSSIPVAAERAMYFDYYNWRGGHDSPGATALSGKWYFAEGCTSASFDTWMLLQNPGDADAHVKLTFMLEDGSSRSREITVVPHSRNTVKVNEVDGMAAASFSTYVDSDVPVTAERSMYFSYRTRDGGSNSFGVAAPSKTWFFAEGYTGE